MAVFHLRDETGRKTRLSGEGPYRQAYTEAKLSNPLPYIDRALGSLFTSVHRTRL
jgi:hypothetical protein